MVTREILQAKHGCWGESHAEQRTKCGFRLEDAIKAVMQTAKLERSTAEPQLHLPLCCRGPHKGSRIRPSKWGYIKKQQDQVRVSNAQNVKMQPFSKTRQKRSFRAVTIGHMGRSVIRAVQYGKRGSQSWKPRQLHCLWFQRGKALKKWGDAEKWSNE